jgi:7-cyano-7-deazaguanine reductase
MAVSTPPKDYNHDEDERIVKRRVTETPTIAKDLKALGSQGTRYEYSEPNSKLLEKFPNPFISRSIPGGVYVGSVNIVCPEFTSLCPKTGQPDFATIIIDYVPGKVCVESKSLKLYLGSFRMHGEFHESCVHRIAEDLIALLDPTSLRVKGEFTPRGGIPFWPTVEYFKAVSLEPLHDAS